LFPAPIGDGQGVPPITLGAKMTTSGGRVMAMNFDLLCDRLPLATVWLALD
jgi:hypothetical protein